VVGKRNKGKPKLTQDEAQKLVDWCLAHGSDPGAIATALAFVEVLGIHPLALSADDPTRSQKRTVSSRRSAPH
jgi:hypothetical protein